MAKKIPFSKAQFIKSAIALEQFPELLTQSGAAMPEIAIVGRSNVGKSSLINHLLKDKGLARTSSTPGKTQLINFFTIDDLIALVDLPGYGFAKVAGNIKKEWSKAIQTYLEERKTLKLILFLVDSRRTPTEDDCAFIEWASFHQTPLLVVFTKIDKITESEKKKNTLLSLEIFKNFLHNVPIKYQYYSIKEGRSRSELIENINRILWD